MTLHLDRQHLVSPLSILYLDSTSQIVILVGLRGQCARRLETGPIDVEDQERPILGRGGYGVVRLADWSTSSTELRKVAVKQLQSTNEQMDLRVAFVSVILYYRRGSTSKDRHTQSATHSRDQSMVSLAALQHPSTPRISPERNPRRSSAYHPLCTPRKRCRLHCRDKTGRHRATPLGECAVVQWYPSYKQSTPVRRSRKPLEA